MSTAKALYERWINELWAGEPVAAEIVSDDFVGHWPDREVHGPDELQAIIQETRKMLADLTFAIEIGPMVDGETVGGMTTAVKAGDVWVIPANTPHAGEFTEPTNVLFISSPQDVPEHQDRIWLE